MGLILLLMWSRLFALAWSNVTLQQTQIMNCFRKAGMLDTALDLIGHLIKDEEDSLLEAD